MAASPSRPTRRKVLASGAIIGATIGIQTIPLSTVLAVSGQPSGGVTQSKLVTTFSTVSAVRKTNPARNQRVEWTATLVTETGNVPVPNEDVSITFAGYTLTDGGTATTDSTGLATANAKPIIPAGTSFTVRFAGNSTYQEAEITGTVT